MPNKKQEIALRLRQVDVLFYGGARGGGKTAYLLADFLMGLNEFGECWRGILFRQSLPELDEVVSMARQMYLPLGAEYKSAEKRFVFPNGGELRLSYLESDSDVDRYQGHNYPWIGFDELGNYRTDHAFNFMMMCNRSAQVPQEWVRMRATGNPGGFGHKWLKARFVEGREPYEIYREVLGKDESGADIAMTSCFVPATVDDNEALLRSNPQYKARLMAQPERVRKAMLEGSWDIKSGGEFFDFDPSVHVMRPAVLKGDWRRYYAMDWGYKTPYAVLKLAVDPDGMVIVYGEIYGQGTADGKERDNLGSRESSQEVAAKVRDAMAQEGVSECVADYNMWEQKFSVQSPVDAFLDAGIDMVKAQKKHSVGWQQVHDLLADSDEFGTPYLRVFSTCRHLIRELETVQAHPFKLDEIADRQADHAVDALRYGVVSELYSRAYDSAEPESPRRLPRSYSYDPTQHGCWKQKPR